MDVSGPRINSRPFYGGSVYIELVKDADILLFNHPSFPFGGWWVAHLSFSKYSHIGLAKWEDNELYCLEFREFAKSRKYKVKDYIAEGNSIDVFRLSPLIQKLEFDPKTLKISIKTHHFDQNRVNNILERAEWMLGRSYSWAQIKNIWFTYMPFVRWFTSSNIKDTNGKTFVWSSFVSYLIRRYYVDPCEFISDEYTKPGDLARSNITNYLFTLD